MAAAYAALVSVLHIIDKLRLHPNPPISLDKTHVESLTGKINFLLEFLEVYNPHLGYSTVADPLESRIADAAYAAEHVIESHIVDHITITNENISPNILYEDLETVIQEMASIEKEAVDTRETIELQNQLQMKSTPPEYSSRSIVHKNSMVGVDDALNRVKDKLTSHRRDLQIIPIVGMGGSGKTTLATNIFRDALVQDHFHICAWATISQCYGTREILRQLLNEQVDQELSGSQVGERLHKYLFGRKYLVVMDDMWNIEAWEQVRRFLPDCKNGSRIVITTRLSNLASQLPKVGLDSLEMRLLDEVESWELLSTIVFGERGCPLELEEIGRRIGKSCKGLPLAIVVVGGLLAKSKERREYWEYVMENLSSIVNLADDERCSRILHMSYRQLPIYLKPCFLYMGVFPEDDVISVSKLTAQWIAQGFLKSMNENCLEEMAKDYLTELTDRNLVMIHEVGSIGNIKSCKIHDLLRDFSLREAQKERFRFAAMLHDPQGELEHALNLNDAEAFAECLRFLRIFQHARLHRQRNMILLESAINLRYIDGLFEWEETLLSSIYRIWDLQTLIVGKGAFSKSKLLIKIWCMPQIRHVRYEELYLTDPPRDSGLLGNLHTLKRVINFKCSEEVVKRVPNLKKLQILYKELDGRRCISKLVCLQKLESLDCFFIPKINPSGPDSLQSLNFPEMLKKLKLRIEFSQCWQDILEKIGSLPLLQKLKLYHGRFAECKWETAEGKFSSLKFLSIDDCDDLKEWRTDSSHFPCLEQLVLNRINQLEEIPLDIAEITTLGLIDLKYCTESVVLSANRIAEEHEQLYGEASVHVRVQTS